MAEKVNTLDLIKKLAEELFNLSGVNVNVLVEETKEGLYEVTLLTKQGF